MIIVTGAAGLVGSNIVRVLNRRGIRDILAVDNLFDGRKIANLADLDIVDFCDKDDFLRRMTERSLLPDQIEAVFHQGATSSTTVWDGRYLMRNNFAFSRDLHAFCGAHRVRLLYASSASVYGHGKDGFRESRECERPLNPYAYSKFQFDQLVRLEKHGPRSQVVGLRYFNVYGPHEAHKGAMASTAFHFCDQILTRGYASIFEGPANNGPGYYRRDFVHVEDCVAVNLWFFDHPSVSGIFNCGTGEPKSFLDVANAVVGSLQQGEIRTVPFPGHLNGVYQNFTSADLTALRNAGCDVAFRSIETGVSSYAGWLAQDETRRHMRGPPPTGGTK